MKRLLLVVLFVALVISGCAKEADAKGNFKPCDSFLKGILNECHVVEHPADPSIDENDHEFDYGAYLHIILLEGKNWEIGNFNTWEVQREEITTLLGIKIYLNRLTYQKKK